MANDRGKATAIPSTLAVVALVGDVQGSREAADRPALQRRLIDAVPRLSRQWQADLWRPVEVARGDEVQALVRSPSAAYGLARALLEVAPMRFGMGAGPVTVGRTAATLGHMDGPCFHRARDALDASLQSERTRRTTSSRRTLTVAGWGELDDAASATWSLVLGLRADWTDRQRKYALLVSQLGTQAAAAKKAGVSRPAVTQALEAARYHAILEAEAAMGHALDARLAEVTA